MCVSKDGFRLVGLDYRSAAERSRDARPLRLDQREEARGCFYDNPQSLTSVWLKRLCWVSEARLLARSETAL
jgi:hypothetical protein